MLFRSILISLLFLTLLEQQVSPQQVQDPHDFIQYDVRKMPTMFQKLGDSTPAQYIIWKMQVNQDGLTKEQIQSIFTQMQGSKLEATPSVLNVQQFPYYALRAEDIQANYGSDDSAREFEQMSPVLISCKLDQNCAFDDGNYPFPESPKNKLVGLKVMFGIIFLGESLVAIFIPWVLRKFFSKFADFLLTLCSTFAAGILIGATFVHLLPQSFEYQNMLVFYNGFPVSMVIALTSYFGVFWLDSVMLSGVGDYRNKPQNGNGGKLKDNEIYRDVEGNGNGNGNNGGNGHNGGNGKNGDGKTNGHGAIERGHINPKFRLQRPISLLFAYLLQAVMIFLAIGLQYNTYTMSLLSVGVFLWLGGEVMAVSTYFVRSGASFGELVGAMIPVAFVPPVFLYAGIGIDHIDLTLQMVFLAFAAGIYLYCACNQILQDDLEHVTGEKSGIKSWIERYLYFIFLCGGIIVFVIAKLVPSDYATIRTIY